VMPVPLFAGSGTRLKVLEAFAAGLPVVSTPKGVEGLDVRAGEHFLTAHSAEEFTDAINMLWSDNALGADLARSASRLVRERYTWPCARRALAAAVADLATEPLHSAPVDPGATNSGERTGRGQ
jgi:glycosyltransferase involved in cell wall biosynthesis